MAELVISINTDTVQTEYRLYSGTSPGPKPLWRFTTEKAIPTSSDTEIYRGELICADEPPQGVICKLLVGNTWVLESEAKMYCTRLVHLDGNGVPFCYGYFIGKSKTGAPVGCLLLEYRGEPMGGDFENQSIETKTDALDILLKIHSVGILHEDWGTHNLLLDANNQLTVIDFSKANLHPTERAKCPLPRNIKLYEVQPLMSDIGCPEIYDAAREMDLFTPVQFSFRGFGVDLRRIKRVQDLVAIGKKSRPNDNEEEIVHEATDLLQWWRKRYGDRFKHKLSQSKPEDKMVAIATEGVAVLSLDQLSDEESTGSSSSEGADRKVAG